MNNKNMTKKERNLLKGAIRRVFSRSELRRRVLATAAVEHFDPERPRVKKWSRCPSCNNLTPTYLMEVDHHSPVVPVDASLEEMSWDTVIDRVWCQENNLTPLCKMCHHSKSKLETSARKLYRKGKNNK